MRETDAHAETSAAPLRGILGAAVVMLLVLGGGLYLWKTCGKKENKETGMWRQVALFTPAPDPCPPPLDSESLSSASCDTRNLSAEGMAGITLALEFIVMDEDSGTTVCMAQKQDWGRTRRTMLVASTV